MKLMDSDIKRRQRDKEASVQIGATMDWRNADSGTEEKTEEVDEGTAETHSIQQSKGPSARLKDGYKIITDIADL